RRDLRGIALGQGPHGEPSGRRDVGADSRRLHQQALMLESAALLRWYVEQGVDDVVGEEAVDRFALPTAASPPPKAAAPAAEPTPLRRSSPTPAPISSVPLNRAPVPLESPQLVEDARELARR